MPFTITREDITRVRADAIVNAANTGLMMGGGVCGAIFRAAGAARLQAACDALAPIATGEAVATPGFALPAKYVIHTAGPVYSGGGRGEEELLRASYVNSLRAARENGCASVAFPLISSGIYGYPKIEAFRAASNAILDFLNGRITDDDCRINENVNENVNDCGDGNGGNHGNDSGDDGDNDIDVTLIVLDKEAIGLTGERLNGIQAFIDRHYTRDDENRSPHANIDTLPRDDETGYAQVAEPPAPAALESLAKNLDETFSTALIKLIAARGLTETEVYRRANIDRRHFSKIRSDPQYSPSKRTAIALAVALKLPAGETRALLARAGYALSRSKLADVIVEYFITNGKHDIFEINEALFYFDLPVLGGVA